MRDVVPVHSQSQLADFQRLMASAVFRPLTPQWRMQRSAEGGRAISKIAASFVKPNDRLTSFERLEIYNRQYWFRLIDCLYEDYPGVRAIVGERRFMKITLAYLHKYPSRTFSLRDLGYKLERFLHELRDEPSWAGANAETLQMAWEMARFEWAQVVAFDGPAEPMITPDDILGKSPADLRLGLQPYLSLLSLNYAVDEFAIGIKKDQALRGEASQAMDSAPKATKTRRIKPPRREKVWLAVHRVENMVYFKRLDAEAFAILRNLGRGLSLELACEKVLSKKHRRDIDWSSKIGEWFNLWSQLGWLTLAPEK